MKSSSSITLSKAWWKKEAPEGLKKSSTGFERALDGYARSSSALKPEPKAIKALEDALDELLSAGKAVAAEAKTLEKKARDKKLAADLSNTVAVMGKPLAKEVASARSQIEQLDSGDGDDAIDTPEAHAAMLRKWAPLIKRGTVNFAVALPGSRPEDIRFSFHKMRAGKAIGDALRKSLSARKFTYGTAGSAALADEAGDDDVRSGTLCLYLEGKQVQGLAKRVKIMFKKQGITQFKKVRILQDGAEIDSADDDTDDEMLEPLDDEDFDGADDGAAPAEAPGPPPEEVPGDGEEEPAAHRERPYLPYFDGSRPAAVPEGVDPESREGLLSRFADAKKDFPRYFKLVDDAENKAAVLKLAAMFEQVMEKGQLDKAARLMKGLEEWAATVRKSFRDLIWEERDAVNKSRLREVYGVSSEDAARIDGWIEQNAMAEDGEIFVTEVGGARLARAIAGNSALGPLPEAAQSYLIERTTREWIISPYKNEDGAEDNISDFTKAIAESGDPDLRSRVASVMIAAFREVSEEQGGTFAIPVRDLHSMVIEYAGGLDPDQLAAFVGDGRALALWISGNLPKPRDSRTLKDRMDDPNFKAFTLGHQAALLKSVTYGSLDEDERDSFIANLLAMTPEKSIKNPDLRGQWAETLAIYQTDKNGLSAEQMMAAQATISSALNDAQGRKLLFSKTVPLELRDWALNQMAARPGVPGHVPWTAEEVKKGWEGDRVSQAYAKDPLELARKEYAAPRAFALKNVFGMESKSEKARMANMLGSALGLPLTNLPPAGETAKERSARLAKEDGHPYYDYGQKPMSNILEHIGKAGGKSPRITPIPVAFTSNEFGASVFRVIRLETAGKDGVPSAVFFDHRGNRYKSAKHWESSNELPEGRITYPEGLDLNNPLTSMNTPKRDESWVWTALDYAAMAAGTVAIGFAIVGTGGAAVGVVAAAAGVYGSARAGGTLADKAEKGWDIGDAGDPEIRALWLEVASGAFSAGVLGGTMRAARLLSANAKMSKLGAGVVAGMSVAENLTDAIAQADSIYQLSKNWDKMEETGKLKALLALSARFTASAANVKRGGRIGDGFSIRRTYNSLEHGSPYDLHPASEDSRAADFTHLAPGQAVVAYDMHKGRPVNYRIVYGGSAKPGRQSIELHSRAASAMEASHSLSGRLRDLMNEAGGVKLEPGTRAWEAHYELEKMGSEAHGLLDRLNAGGLDEAGEARIRTRLDEINAAMIAERQMLDAGIAREGRGYVAAPSQGSQDAEALGWPWKPAKGAKFDPETEVPPGHHWRSRGPGKTPLLVQHDTSKTAYTIDPSGKKIVPVAKLAPGEAERLALANGRRPVAEPAAPAAAAGRADLEPVLDYAKPSPEKFKLLKKVLPRDSKFYPLLHPAFQKISQLRVMQAELVKSGKMDAAKAAEIQKQFREQYDVLDGIAGNDPVFAALMSVSDETIASNLDLLTKAAKSAYENKRGILEEFARTQREARARGDVNADIYVVEVGARMSRSGDWAHGRPGNDEWIPKEPHIKEQMEALQRRTAATDPEAAKHMESVTFRDGYPDLAPFRVRVPGEQGDQSGVIQIGEAEFYPARFYELAEESIGIAPAAGDPVRYRREILSRLAPEERERIAGMLTNQEMGSMRGRHFELADERFAKRMKWLNPDGSPDTERVREMREGRDSTRPKVEYPDGTVRYPPLKQMVDGKESLVGGFTWHHVEDSGDLILVPRFLHGHLPHEGGISTRGKVR